MKVIENAISPFLVNKTVQALKYNMPHMDVYDDPFESKLQLKKDNHNSHPFEEVLHHLLNPTTIALMSTLFDVPLLPTSDDYHTAYFVYRPGDFLQYHLDAAIHDGKRKLITANLYFTECEGGEFVYKDELVRPKAGTLIAFLNTDDAYHGVRPVTDGLRMLVSVGYIGTSTKYTVTARTNERALFEPWPYEQWDDNKWQLARERATSS